LVGFVPPPASCRFVRPSRSGHRRVLASDQRCRFERVKPPRTSNPSLSPSFRCPGRRTAFPQELLLVAQAVAVRVDVGSKPRSSELEKTVAGSGVPSAANNPRTADRAAGITGSSDDGQGDLRDADQPAGADHVALRLGKQRGAAGEGAGSSPVDREPGAGPRTPHPPIETMLRRPDRTIERDRTRALRRRTSDRDPDGDC